MIIDSKFQNKAIGFEKIKNIWKSESNNFAFIPFPRLEMDYKKGRFFFNEDGFIYIGSVESEYTPIHAVYIFPHKRNGSPDKIRGILRMLPKKKYKVTCHVGKTFWERHGLKVVGTRINNARKRNVFILEGEIEV